MKMLFSNDPKTSDIDPSVSLIATVRGAPVIEAYLGNEPVAESLRGFYKKHQKEMPPSGTIENYSVVASPGRLVKEFLSKEVITTLSLPDFTLEKISLSADQETYTNDWTTLQRRWHLRALVLG